MIETDVLIIGAGPAGSFCAAHLVRNGVNCIVLDKSDFPRFKPCAGWVTPGVLKTLRLKPDDYPLGLTHFSSFDISINGFQFKLPTNQYSIRRFEFDAWLLKSSGADFRVHQVKSIENRHGRYVIDGEYSAKYLVGAAGTHCPVARTFFPTRDPARLIVAMEEEFEFLITDPACKLWFFEERLPGYAWYVPKVNGILNVGIGAVEGSLKKRGASLKDYWEKFTSKLHNGGLVRDHNYHASGHSYYLHRNLVNPRLGNAFLVGDSLGLSTLDMGEGIGPALQSGRMAAESILTGKLYQPWRITRYSFPSILGLRP